MKYTIEELVAKVNSLLVSSEVVDGRVSNSLSVRRVRDYQSKGLLREPHKSGRNTYYDDEHVEQLVALRSMQSTGLSDSFMQKLSSTSPLYYQSSEVQEQVSSNIGSVAQYASTSTNTMKDKALAALNKCAIGSQESVMDKQINSTSLAYRGISAAGAMPLMNVGKGLTISAESADTNLKDKLSGANLIYPNEVGSIDDFPIEFQVNPEKEKEHAKRYEESLRKPHHSNMYNVHERVSLEVKNPYSLTEEDKSKIIERLKDIINSL